MPSADNSVRSQTRSLRVLAAAIAVMAVAFACVAVAPQRAYAYSKDPDGAIGKVTGAKYNRTFYGTSVEDVMHIADDMTSTRNNKLHEDEVTIELLCDWNTKSYGRIKVPNGCTYRINLNGHMINRDRALNFGKDDDRWYADGSGEVIYVDGGTLYLDGGTGESSNIGHAGYTDDNGHFWKYDGKGSTVLKGGLITGGACDDWHGAGGISLASSQSRAFIKNTTIAGNITDQVDSSRYGHGAGIAVHASNCALELDNVKVDYNHAEGYGGGIYFREAPASLAFNNSEVSNNIGIKGGGGIYFDCKISQTIESVKVDGNVTHSSGGGIYFASSDSKLTLKGSSENRVSVSGNTANKYGGGIYSGGSSAQIDASYADVNGNKAEGGGFYINGNSSKVTLTNCGVSQNSPEADGGGFYIDGNDCTVLVKDSNMSGNSVWDHNGGAMYHNGKRGSVTFENTTLAGNDALDRSGGLVYDRYNGTTFTIKDSTVTDSSAAKGGVFYLEDVATLIFDNATVKECRADAFDEAGGGVIYNTDDGTKVDLKNGAQFCNNSALSEGDGGAIAEGGAVYSTDTITISSSDGTGSITGNVAKIDASRDGGYGGKGGNGGAIWFKGELYLDNISITGNKAVSDPVNNANGYGGGIYCANDSYKAFEVARTVKITGNTADRGPVDAETGKVSTVDSNLYLIGSSGQEVCSAAGDRALTAESRIGVEAGMGSASRRRVSGNQAMLTNIKDCYDTVFASDSSSYSIALDGNYVYLSDGLPSHTVSVRTGCYSRSWSAKTGSEVKLYTDEWLAYEEDPEGYHYMNECRYGSVDNKIDYWTVTDATGTRKVEVRPTADPTADERQVATFKIRGSDTTAVPHIIRPVGAVGLKIVDNAGWGDLAEGSASVSLTYTNIRDAAGSVLDSDVWDPDDWEQIYMLVKQAGTDKLDSITTDSSTLASATAVKRAKVEDVKKGGAVIAKKVTYSATLKKSLLGDELYSMADRLIAFEAQVNNSNLGDQVVEDQTDSARLTTYRSKVCSVSSNDAGDMTISFDVTYPAAYTVTFDAGEGSFANGIKNINFYTRSDGTLATLPSEAPTRKGYAFDGWYLAADQGEPSGTAVNTSTVFGSDTKVVAKWREVGEVTKYRMVLYMSQEGDDADDLSTVDVDLAVFEGEAVTAKIERPVADPEREGYVFGGWYTDAACTTGNEFFNSAGEGVVAYANDDLCLYAKWTPVSYAVTFDADGGTPAPVEQSVAYKKKASKPSVPSKTGYTFLYWALDGSEYDFDTPVTSAISLKAVWQKNSHIVEYKSGDKTVAKAKVADGGKTISADPGENKGYRFDGWCTDEACAKAYDFDTPVTRDMTLYAKWVKTCTVTFKTPEDAEQVEALTVDARTKIVSDDLPRPVRENYRFHGWLKDGTAVATEFTVNDNIELESHWVGRTVFVYLLDNDDADYKMMKYGDTLTEESLAVKAGQQNPVREGYAFEGWYADDACTEAVEYGSTLTDDLYLHPKWVAESRTVSFDAQGGSSVPAQTVSYSDCANEPEAPTRQGCVFKGWFTDKKRTEPWSFNKPVTKNMTLCAKWADTVTVTLDANGGIETEPSSVTIESGTAVGVLPVPRRATSDPYGEPSADDGYVFAGWHTKDGTKVDAETKFSEDAVLTAWWARNGEVCFVSYYSNGEMLNYDVVKTGKKLTKPADPARTGYDFAGWYTNEDCAEAYDFDSAVTEDLKLFAGWKEVADGDDSDDGKKDDKGDKKDDSSDRGNTDDGDEADNKGNTDGANKDNSGSADKKVVTRSTTTVTSSKALPASGDNAGALVACAAGLSVFALVLASMLKRRAS